MSELLKLAGMIQLDDVNMQDLVAKLRRVGDTAYALGFLREAIEKAGPDAAGMFFFFHETFGASPDLAAGRVALAAIDVALAGLDVIDACAPARRASVAVSMAWARTSLIEARPALGRAVAELEAAGEAHARDEGGAA